MKKFKFSLAAMMVAMLTMCVAFTSCSNDDDPVAVAAAAASEVAGTYVDSLQLTVMGSTSTYKNLEVKVEAANEETVNIILPAYGEGRMALPSLTIPAVKVAGSNNNYAFGVTDYKSSVEVNGVTKEFTMTLQGTYVAGKLTLNYTLVYGTMPMPMVCKFVATKK